MWVAWLFFRSWRYLMEISAVKPEWTIKITRRFDSLNPHILPKLLDVEAMVYNFWPRGMSCLWIICRLSLAQWKWNHWGIPSLGKWFTSQNVYIFFKYSKHFLFLKSCLPPSHTLNLSICNCDDAVMYHSGAPSERRICHLCCWEYTARSQPSSGVVSANRATLPMVIPHRFRGLAALSPRLRTVLKWHLLCRLLVAQLKIPLRLSCTSNFQAAPSYLLPVLPPKSSHI